MEVDAGRARQLSLFRPLGTVPTTPPDEPLTPVAGAPWRDDWMWILTGVVGYQRNSCGYCKSDDGSELHFALLRDKPDTSQVHPTTPAPWPCGPSTMRISFSGAGDGMSLDHR